MLVIFYLGFFVLFWPLSPLKSPALQSPLIRHLGSFYSHLDLWHITVSCLKIWHIHKMDKRTGLTRSHITPTGAAQSWKLIPWSSRCTSFMLMLIRKEVWGSAEHWHFCVLFALPLNVMACKCFRFAITLFTVDIEKKKCYKLTFCNSDILLQHHNQLQWSL